MTPDATFAVHWEKFIHVEVFLTQLVGKKKNGSSCLKDQRVTYTCQRLAESVFMI